MEKDLAADSSFNTMQRVKRHFFAMRNGVIADRLRSAGSPFRIIFGLNLPQLMEAAAMFGPDAELAMRLWNNTSTRESMLLAPMLLDPGQVTMEQVKSMVPSIPAMEVADILCHRLLRKLPFASELAADMVTSASEMERYTGFRLWLNILPLHPEEAAAAAAAEVKAAGTQSPLALRILEEHEFITNFAQN